MRSYKNYFIRVILKIKVITPLEHIGKTQLPF